VDARRGLRVTSQLGRGTRPFGRGRGRVPEGHLDPGGGAGRRRRRVRGSAALQWSADIGAQLPRGYFCVVPSDGWLHGTE